MSKLSKNLFILAFISVLTISNAFGQVRTIADRSDNAELKKATADFQKANDLPGISAVIIRDGTVILNHGEGFARPGVKADGNTVYHAASVSKVIAGTLAVKLGQNNRLENGKRINFKLDKPTAYYLKNIKQTRGKVFTLPSHHTHTVAQLFAHLGCVQHYDGRSPVKDSYPKAIDALPGIWNQKLLDDCEVGKDYNYSTHAFTYIAAALEQATGKTAAQLVRSEIAVPHNLNSLRASWNGVRYSKDKNLAIHYNEQLKPIKLWNNSWKVLGGGLQISTLDLAKFGLKVQKGEIVSTLNRDKVLWKRVTSSKIRGIGWRLPMRNGVQVAEHGGKQEGVRTNLRVYRDKKAPLVIAIMTNREFFKKGNLNSLSDTYFRILYDSL